MSPLPPAAHSCMDCALAKWERTKTGRLHPSGDGRCQWKAPDIAVSAAFYFSGYKRKALPEPSGGYIERKQPYTDCPTWREKANAQAPL